MIEYKRPAESFGHYSFPGNHQLGTMRSLLFFCLVGSAFGLIGMVPKAILKKYSHHKIMASCLGEQVVEEYTDLLKTTARKCAMKLKEGMMAHDHRDEDTHEEHHEDDDDKGQKYIDKLTVKAEIMSCLFQEMNYTDENDQPVLQTLMNEVDELDIPSSLKEDFRESAQHCYDFSNCLPVDEAKHPQVRKMGRALAFMKCLEKKEVLACMRQDFIKYAYKQDLDGNDRKVFELIMIFGDGKEELQLF